MCLCAGALRMVDGMHGERPQKRSVPVVIVHSVLQQHLLRADKISTSGVVVDKKK